MCTLRRLHENSTLPKLQTLKNNIKQFLLSYDALNIIKVYYHGVNIRGKSKPKDHKAATVPRLLTFRMNVSTHFTR